MASLTAPPDPVAGAPLLSVTDLCTYFRTEHGVVKAVDGVSFDVRRGELLGIVGESGSGKSVTSLSIMGLLPKDDTFHPRGQVSYAGRDLLAVPESELRRLRGDRICMIFQDPMTSLNPYLTVERQLSEVLELHRGASRRAARASALEMLERVGIPDPKQRLDDYPHQLSGGMRQRVMIAMALLCEPELLIADEPTTALDVTIQAQILGLIVSLQRELGTAVILITHDLGIVAGMASRVLVMYAGRVVEGGPTDAIFARPAHRYTSALLGTVPRLDRPRGVPLAAIAGMPPNLGQLPSGCPFHPRCPAASHTCVDRYPPRTDAGLQHFTHCHHPTLAGPST